VLNRSRRLIPATVLALVLGAGLTVSQAQIICSIPCPIWDPVAVIQHTLMNSYVGQMITAYEQQVARFQKMAARLSKYTDLAKYVISLDDTPEWRIHDWWTDAVLYAKEFHAAMTYGDSAGTGYATVALPRVAADDILARLPADAAASLRSELATMDVADSTIIRAADASGRVRFNGRKEAQAIDDLQNDVTDTNDEQSMTAVLEKMSGAALVEAQQKQARVQLINAMLEQLLVDSKRDRDYDAVQMNMLLDGLRDGKRVGGESMINGAAESLRTWRMP
jgi:hypothetical protein